MEQLSKGTTDNMKKVNNKNVDFGLRDNRNYMHTALITAKHHT